MRDILQNYTQKSKPVVQEEKKVEEMPLEAEFLENSSDQKIECAPG